MKTEALMKALSGEGKYEITSEMREKLDDFYGNFAKEEEAFLSLIHI